MATSAVLNLQDIIIEPFDHTKHDRTAFSCGVNRLDNFLKNTARKHQAKDFARIWVATDSRQTDIFGYYALNVHFLEDNDLPAQLTKDAPRSGIPTLYLSMIAVDRRYQSQTLGRILLADALDRAVGAADNYMGLKAVILDVIEDGGVDVTEKRRAFYASMGFQSFPSCPLRMFVAIETVRKARP